MYKIRWWNKYIFVHCDETHSYEIGTVTTNNWNHIVISYEHNSGTDSNLRTFLGNKTSDPVVESSLENAYLNTEISPNSTNGLKIDVVKIGTNRNQDDGGKFFVGYISATGIYDGALNTVGVKVYLIQMKHVIMRIQKF